MIHRKKQLLVFKRAEIIESDEIQSDQEALENGLRETVDGTRLAKGLDWEIWCEPLNFVLRVNSKNYYFSSFKGLLDKLSDHRIKYWLTQDKWNHVQDS